ncbi:MAG: sugar phosphate nucleotidyltransferase [Nitrososphaerota archaeon]|nr:sugar phosphate nucleotidyltransferase [Nitrososphaerota archaeon]
MKAVVLAAGEGQRLRPLTLTRPKHLIPVMGRPLLEHLLLSIREAGINDVLIVVHYKAEMIKEYFGDGSKLGIRIEYAYQEAIKGTADAFRVAETYVDGDFLAVYGDLLLTTNAIKSAINTHARSKPAATLTTLMVEHPEHYGIIRTIGESVIEIIEKPPREHAVGNPINAGIYIFSKDIFDAIAQTEPSPRGELEITDSIQRLIKSGRNVVAARISPEDWLDIGKPWDILEANYRLLRKIEPKSFGLIENGAHIKGPVYIDDGARVRSGAYIEGPVYIGANSDIGPNCYIRPYTSIGRGVRIGNACEIKNSVIMDFSHIGHLSYVGDSIIGENCNLGAGTITANLRFDLRTVKMTIKDELIDSGRKKLGAVLGDNVKTGVGALLMPGVKVGCNSWIGPNTIVSKDAPSNVIIFLRERIEQRSLQHVPSCDQKGNKRDPRNN